MKQHTATAIIDSLVEKPNEWKFDENDLESIFIRHKSGFSLITRHSKEVEVWSPSNLRHVKFSREEMNLIDSAISSIKADRIIELQDDARVSIVNMLKLPWWKRIFK